MLILVKRLVGMSVGGGIGAEWCYEKSGLENVDIGARDV